MKLDVLKIEDEIVRIVTVPYCVYAHSGIKTKGGAMVKCGVLSTLHGSKDYCCPYCVCANNGVAGHAPFPVVKLFIVVVISRRDGKPYLYNMPTAVFTQIQKLAKDARWGNPDRYDLHIRRSDVPYIQFEVLAKPWAPLSQQDLDIKNSIDLEWLKEASSPPKYTKGIIPEYEVVYK